MKKHLLLAAFLLTSLYLSAQKSFTFEFGFIPNKKYTTQMTTEVNGLINMKADEATMKQMADNGMELPMKMVQNTNATLTSITSEKNSEGNIPMSITYDKMGMEMSLNGEEVPVPNVFENVTIYGTYLAGSKMQIDSISGNSVTQDIKNTLEIALEQVQKEIQFPEHPIKIGDSFDNEIPMKLPMANMAPMEMTVKATYNLQQVENGIAFFNVEQSIDLNSEQTNMSIKAEGAGSGKMQYKIKDHYMSRYEANLPMKMSMVIGGTMNMDMEMDTKTVLSISME